MKDKNKQNEIRKETRRVIRLALLISFGVWLIGAVVTRFIGVHCFPCNEGDSAAAGLFGDSFGAVNALISAMAFAGVIVSFWLQRKEFELQREDLKLQYEELHAQREEFEQQNKTLKLQRFESTFFHMMELQQQIVSDLCIQLQDSTLVANTWIGLQRGREVYVNGLLRGRQVFAYIYWHQKSGGIPNGILTTMHDKGIEAYPSIPDIELLDHYFRHLYTILRYVDESDAFKLNDDGELDEAYEREQKYHYTTIIRATLSRFELLVLYYNGLSIYGREKLKPLIEKYALLNNIDKESLSISKELNTVLPNIRPVGWAGKYGLTGKDYEFYLTNDVHDKSSYQLSAFCHTPQEFEEANTALSNYKKFLAGRIANQPI